MYLIFKEVSYSYTYFKSQPLILIFNGYYFFYFSLSTTVLFFLLNPL
jgi:hypothetical protein